MGRLSSRDRKLAHLAGENVSNIENRYFSLASVNADQTVLGPPAPLTLVPTTGITATAQRVCWQYIGYTQKSLLVDYVQFIQTGTAAGGAQVAELGLATSTSAPDGTAKTLTVTAVTASLPDLTTGTLTNGLVRQNSTAAGWTVSPATHLWACARFNMATTQPTYVATATDWQIGLIQFTASIATAITVGTSYTGALFTATLGTGGLNPYLRLVARP